MVSFLFDNLNAFTISFPPNIHHFKPPNTLSSTNKVLHSKQDNNDEAWDADTDYPDFDPDEDEDDLLLNFAENGLGIDIGKQMGSMTPEEIADIKAEASEALESAFDGQIKEIEIMKKKMAKDFEKSKRAMDFASELNAQRETEKLMNKIDAISDKFLSENEALRMGTKQAAAADLNMIGKGIEIGSWGVDDDGFAVTLEGGALIGGANSATPAMSYVNEEGEEVKLEAVKENKILIVIDENEVS